jgi:methionyl-tRNA formyltransferase
VEVVFLGTPQFAVATLEAVAAAGHHIQAVYTQPDRPKGRGQQTAFSPVKESALKLGLTVKQPERVRRPEIVEELRAMNSDVMVVVGYGQIIPQSIIDLPRFGILNVHASLLPKYRGAAPIQWAIANGETRTGVTIMQIEAGLDTGPTICAEDTAIGPEETAPELSARLAAMGARLLVETLAKLPVPVTPQDGSIASLAPILKKEDGRIDWTQPARVIACRLRGFTPWPGAFTVFRGEPMKVIRARVAEESMTLPRGTLRAHQKRLYAGAGDSTVLELLEVQMEGRKKILAEAFVNGFRPLDNEILGG